MSDDAIAMTTWTVRPYHCNPKVEIRGLTTEWKTIAQIEKGSGQFPQFVNEGTVFVSGHPWELVRTDGKIVFTESAPFGGNTAIPGSWGPAPRRSLFPVKGSSSRA